MLLTSICRPRPEQHGTTRSARPEQPGTTRTTRCSCPVPFPFFVQNDSVFFGLFVLWHDQPVAHGQCGIDGWGAVPRDVEPE